MADLEVKKREISAIVDEILSLTRALAVKGIDARDPSDRQAYDIVCRIERRIMAQSPKKKTA